MRRDTLRLLSWLTSFCVLLNSANVARSADDKAQAKPVDFSHDVVPLLKKHCVGCHSGPDAKGGFSISTRELLLDAGGAKPGNSAESYMIELITSTDPEMRMPPIEKPGLNGDEVAVLKRWIDEGLKWENGFAFGPRTYEPPLLPQRPELPPAVDGRTHPVDRIVDAYFAEHDIARPVVVDDEAFLRRVSLDLTGLLPPPEVRDEFLADQNPEKRTLLVRRLLDDDIAYAEHWLTFWNDLLRNDYSGTGFITGGRKQITNWLYRSLVENKPYDQMVRELLTPVSGAEGFVQGIRWRGNVSAGQRQEIQFAQNVGQALLGINLKCASCHDSFIDRWTLEETYGLAQIYATEQLTLHRCDKPVDRTVGPGWLFPEIGNVDPQAAQPERMKQLAALVTHPDNGRFTRTIVNRLWHRLMGRGIVHPVDAMHTQPWSVDLLDYLAADLLDRGFDLKQALELICTSQTYQAATPPIEHAPDEGSFVFRGPLPRRMTAEQFVDSVWQLTGAAPTQFDAQVVRAVISSDEISGPAEEATLTARWIWSTADAASPGPPGGQQLSLRRTFDLPAVPVRAAAATTCDNEYVLYINGQQVAADTNWESVELVGIQSRLRAGKNEILVVAKNGGSGPNPAGLIFEARIALPVLSGAAPAMVTIASDEQWQWAPQIPDARGRFRDPKPEWQPAVLIAQPQVWASRANPQLQSLLTRATTGEIHMVRASLLKADELMRALGRPNRDQIVTSRPTDLTTLEAIDLANGQRLADAIVSGASSAASRYQGAPDELIDWLYAYALSRRPTKEERTLAIDYLGQMSEPTRVEDVLWSVVMLPEFQLVR
ncbi:DUF1549 domain-containing protein [bacterium]|nr:DUF1549 domain-containing protein [bacterium]